MLAPLNAPSPPRGRFDLTPLGHPLWWVSLGVLVVNDDLLKGRGIAPGWLTGKLSDFAFLVVAPVLFACLLPVTLRGRRVLAASAVVGLYVAADLSRAVSDAVVDVAARLGMTWRLWPDPTDLLALAVLPATIWLLRAPERRRPARARRPGLERSGVVVGALACLATSAPPRYWHYPFLVNRASDASDVQITWVLRKVDCSLSPAELAATLTPGDLDDPRPMTLGSGEVANLAGPPAAGTSPVGKCEPTGPAAGAYGPCVAAILEAPGASPVVMTTMTSWSVSSNDGFISCGSSEPVSACRANLNPRVDPGPDAVSLVASGGALAFVVSGPPPRAPDAGTMTDTGFRPDAGLGNIVPATAKRQPDDAPVRIRLAPVDLAAVAARASTPDACRTTRDTYHASLAQTSCASDADCQALVGPPIPGDPAACAAYVNRSVSADAVSGWTGAWADHCLTIGYGCELPRPAACTSGTCTEICPGVELPSCPPTCRSYDSTTDRVCLVDDSCLDDAGETCTCPNGKLQCTFTPAAPGCPLSCYSPTWTSFPPAPSEGGSSLDGAAELPDAREAGAAPGDGAAARSDANNPLPTDGSPPTDGGGAD
jgi:hypothetical protein